MKKQGKKLVLARESLRIMDERLGMAVAGATNVTCDNSCDTLIGSYCTCTNGPMTHCI
jgi:hypothetical protein